ncbi:MAG: ABC transporter permease [Anaerolineae bacterium]|nr:ABC transporter permease [Anaerolineae bacterium]
MIPYIARRFLFFLLTLWITSILVFGATTLLPGDVAGVILGRDADQTARDNLKRELGLDQPVVIQYVNWLSRFVRGDWGQSYALRRPIQPLVLQRLSNSLRLALVALIISIPPAIALGVVAGLNENKWIDTLLSVGSLILVGLPEFVVGYILINVVALGWRWLPSSSAGVSPETPFVEALPQLILPSLAVAATLLAYIGRLTRIGVIAEMRRNYVRTAALKGLPYWRIIVKHVLRNALLPTITVIAISLGWLIGGLVVIENVFAYRGLGLLLISAITNRDLPLIQAVTMISVTVFSAANLLADIVYSYLNPRIRLQ